MRRFDQNVNAPSIAFKEATRRTPDRAGNILIWLAFAGGTIVLYIICVAMITSKHEYMNWAGWLSLLTVVGVVILVVVDRDQVRTFEKIIGHDLDGDGYVGTPPQMSIEVQHNERQTSFMDLPGPPQAIIAWSRAAVSGHSLAYENWEPLFGSYMTPMGKKIELYRAFRQVCAGRGYIIEQGTHSCDLTEDGKDFFANLATKTIHDATPLLEG